MAENIQIKLFKSSSKTVWPVLGAIHLDPMRILPVALTYGETKPDNHEFFTRYNNRFEQFIAQRTRV